MIFTVLLSPDTNIFHSACALPLNTNRIAYWMNKK